MRRTIADVTQALLLLVLASTLGCARDASRSHAAGSAAAPPPPTAAPAPPLPPADVWRPIPGGPNAPDAREYAFIRATDREIIVWGGLSDPRERGWMDARGPRTSRLATRPEKAGAILDRATNRWRPMSTIGQPAHGWIFGQGRTWPIMLTPAHRAMIVCTTSWQRGELEPAALDTECARYDLDTDRWSSVARPTFSPLGSGCATIDHGARIVCVTGHRTEIGYARERTMIYEVSSDRWIDAGPVDPAQQCEPERGDCWFVGSRVVPAGNTVRSYALRWFPDESTEAAEFELERRADGSYRWRALAPWTFEHVDAIAGGWPLRVGDSSFFVRDTAYGSDCGRAPDAGCTLGFEVQRVRDGVTECRTVITRAGRSKSPGDEPTGTHCDPWPSGNGFVCSGERTVLDSRAGRYRELASWAFACSWSGDEPTCFRITDSGQPTYRRHPGILFTGEELIVWGGRATSLDSPNCIDGSRAECGISLDGPLLGDGAIVRPTTGPPALVTPCYCYRARYCSHPTSLPTSLPAPVP